MGTSISQSLAEHTEDTEGVVVFFRFHRKTKKHNSAISARDKRNEVDMDAMKKVVLTICMVALMPIFPNFGYADEFKLTPTIGVREAYDDNIFFDTQNEVDDYITSIFGGLDLLNRTQRLDLNLSARGNGLLYKNNNDLNDVEQYYKGDIGYRLTERVNVAANGGYSEDSQPDRDIATTGIVFSGVNRKQWNAGASGGVILSEESKLSLSYAYNRTRFDSSAYVDYDFHNANLGYTHDLSEILPRVIGRINAGYAHYDAEDTDIEIWSATLGFSRALTEIFDLQVDAGARYTVSKFQVPAFVPYPPFFVTVTDTEYDWGPTGRIVLSYKGEKTHADISASKEIQPASVENGTSDRTSFTFNIRHRFAEKFSAHLTSGYFLNKADAGQLAVEGIDEETINIQTGLSYEIINNLVLTASYTYSQVKYKLSDTEAKRNRVFLQLSYGIPLFE